MEIVSAIVVALLSLIGNCLTSWLAHRKSTALVTYRLEQLEKVTVDIPGIEKTFAVQAGRELRVIVKPEEVDDLTSYKIAREVKEKIENEMQYPGTIKVTVIREIRAQEEAK